jgi:hypothetical protein
MEHKLSLKFPLHVCRLRNVNETRPDETEVVYLDALARWHQNWGTFIEFYKVKRGKPP